MSYSLDEPGRRGAFYRLFCAGSKYPPVDDPNAWTLSSFFENQYGGVITNPVFKVFILLNHYIIQDHSRLKNTSYIQSLNFIILGLCFRFQALTVLVLIAYLAISIQGVVFIENGASTTKMIMEDAEFLSFDERSSRDFLDYSIRVSVSKNIC